MSVDKLASPATPIGRDKYTIVYTAKGLMRAKMNRSPGEKTSFSNLQQTYIPKTRLGSPRRSDVETRSFCTREGTRTTIPSRGDVSRNYQINTSPIASSGLQSIQFPASTKSVSRAGYKWNLSGRSVKACGAFGRSDSPASHSGMDPDLPRGQSSQLDFDICANED
jgi:hypothetical protein